MQPSRTSLIIGLVLGFALALVLILGAALILRNTWQVETRTTPSPVPTPSYSRTPLPVTPGASSATPGVSAAESTLVPQVLLPFIVRAPEPATPTPTATKKPTKTPKPSATPTPSWPEPLAAPGRSKLGLHVQWNNSQDIMTFIRVAKPRVVKAMDDLGFLADVKKESPETITVGRFSDSTVSDGDPKEAARAFVAHHLERYLANPAVDYWEGLNEPVYTGRMEWFATFEAERVRLMAEYGLRCAIGSFSAGVPEYEEFVEFLPAIEAAKRYGGVLSLHEYDAPTMQRLVGAGLPGHTGRSDRGALALRYRWWYEDILEPRGLVIPLIITEAGVDGAVNPPEAEGKGWRDFVDYWASHGLGTDGTQIYIDQLAWYDSELQKDDYVLGFAVFTAGAIGDQWESYDITPILRSLAFYVVKQGN